MSDHAILRCSLSAATCVLLSDTAHAEQSDWQVDAAILTYAESGRRTEVFGPVIHARRGYADGDELRLKFGVDVITGASPTGAMPSSELQTFTRPSGKGNYTISPGEIPVDDTFMDTRVSFSVDREQVLDRFNRWIIGGAYSYEYDFISYALRTTFAHDLEQKDKTLSVGLAYESNLLDPEGGVPIERSTAMVPSGGLQNRRDEKDDREQVDLLFGLTQVLSRTTIMQLNLGYGQSKGYHSDPFKVVSIVEAADMNRLGEPLDNIFESRPIRRTKKTIFGKVNHHLKRDIVSLSYRWMDDDWGVQSHTVDVWYTIIPGKETGTKWQPHIRFYRQHAADFYRTNLLNTETVPTYVSADYRLGDMDSITLGLKYVFPRNNGKPFEIRLEYIRQDNTPSSGSKIGYLETVDIVDDTSAAFIQLNYVL